MSIELKEALVAVVGDLGLAIMEGNKIVEVKSAGVNKGRAAHRWMAREEPEFVFFAGDDRTDEDVFEAAPDEAWTVKVGRGRTIASHSVRSVYDVRDLLEEMLEA